MRQGLAASWTVPRLANAGTASYDRGVKITSTYFLERGRDSVELWSTARLQFEPKGWQLEMRHDLRDALRALDGDQVSALYASPLIDSRCDIENILIYNVGAATFRQLSA